MSQFSESSALQQSMRRDAEQIIHSAIQAVLPDQAVQRALQGRRFSGRVFLVAVGKAAWQMADAASRCLGDQITAGAVITKYGHVQGPIANITCYEAGHPVPDENSFQATRAVLELVRGLSGQDTVLFLLSGGGSALFELPLIPIKELQCITNQLLASGADIVEINTIRKRLSGVKGGRFAQLCAPAKIVSVVLSDILGDPLDMIASGPACPDRSTCAQAQSVVEKYHLNVSARTMDLLSQETPKRLAYAESCVVGSVRALCSAAAEACRSLGYRPVILTDQLCCQAREAGSFLASIAKSHADTNTPLAFLAGGETVVRLTGSGKGGRNQELALAAAQGIAGLPNVLAFSVGSDGTDGPTDAAGGITDGGTAGRFAEQGVSIAGVLDNNDAYHALKKVDGLIMTGPTGTNVNDVSAVLIRPL